MSNESSEMRGKTHQSTFILLVSGVVHYQLIDFVTKQLQGQRFKLKFKHNFAMKRQTHNLNAAADLNPMFSLLLSILKAVDLTVNKNLTLTMKI